jgi:hypothetical protein
MSANQELDRLLNNLRQEAPNCALDDVERRVWQQIAGGRHEVARAGMSLSFLLASVVAAFVWGIFAGADVTGRRDGSDTTGPWRPVALRQVRDVARHACPR